MKVYLASRFSNHPYMREVRDILKVHGHEVTSRWIDLHEDIKAQKHSFTPAFMNESPYQCHMYAKHDLEDIDSAECVVSFSGTGGKGGRHVEFGYGLAQEKIMIIVGDRENVFHCLDDVRVVKDVEELVDELAWLES